VKSTHPLLRKAIAADINLTSVVLEFAEAKLEGLNIKISCFSVIYIKNFESFVEQFNDVNCSKRYCS